MIVLYIAWHAFAAAYSYQFNSELEIIVSVVFIKVDTYLSANYQQVFAASGCKLNLYKVGYMEKIQKKIYKQTMLILDIMLLINQLYYK